ncbi:MAG: PilN domain-containing protein [Methylomonas sp.]|jgi:hypothetical protein
MIQQINLYQSGKNGDSRLLLNPYVLIVLAASMLVILMSGYGLSNFYANQAKQKDLKIQLQQIQARIQKIQADNPSRQTDTALILELQKTQTDYQNMSQTQEMLADVQSDQSRGFSRYFTALAGLTDHNIWLTRILFNGETGSIRLEGSTFKAERIALMLESLQTTNVFEGRHFATLDIDQSQKNPEQVDFSVSSSLSGEGEH